jgi:ParB-like chromosome segregation protein Spo0J
MNEITIRDQIERWPIEKLIPYARNSRTHSAEQVGQIAASMREWGWTNPVLAREDGTLIAGHGRVLAAQQLGLPEAPVIVARGWTDAQVRAYVIADNKLAENAGWDNAMLALELKDLSELDFDMSLTGFEQSEMDELLAGLDDEGTPAPASPGIVYQEKFAVLVECQTEADQERIYNQLTGLGLTCKVLVN